MTRRVCALVEAGAEPGRNPLLAPLRALLAEQGIELVAWDPTGALALPPEAPDADLYLVKGDHPSVLCAAACMADAGAPCLNGVEATAAAADKGRMLARLAAAGLPVPQTQVAGDREALLGLVAGRPRFVKPLRGAHGEGARLVRPGQADAMRGAGPWLVQEPIAGDGYDLKCYGVDDRVAVRRARFVPGVVDLPREPVADPDPAIVRQAVEAGRAAGLRCFGADFVVGPDGPVLVDVNAFPGFRGVEEGPGWVADAVLSALRAA